MQRACTCTWCSLRQRLPAGHTFAGQQASCTSRSWQPAHPTSPATRAAATHSRKVPPSHTSTNASSMTPLLRPPLRARTTRTRRVFVLMQVAAALAQQCGFRHHPPATPLAARAARSHLRGHCTAAERDLTTEMVDPALANLAWALQRSLEAQGPHPPVQSKPQSASVGGPAVTAEMIAADLGAARLLSLAHHPCAVECTVLNVCLLQSETCDRRSPTPSTSSWRWPCRPHSATRRRHTSPTPVPPERTPAHHDCLRDTPAAPPPCRWSP